MPTFPNYTPHYGSQPKTDIKILEAEFGDGYTQRAADGINSVRETWEVEWKSMEKAIIFEMVAFIKARKGFESFDWTAPGDTVPRKWTCKSFTGPTPVPGSQLYDLRATFREEFDL